MEAPKLSAEKKEDGPIEKPADFETAINAAGFGVFNCFLLLIGLLGCSANSLETTTISYILPIAECDLKLSLEDKGVLNAATYGGMIISAFFWGYLADTQGRRKLLIICYLLDALCVFASSLSQNIATLIAFKFFGGIMVNGPSAILLTYYIEVHSGKNRSKIVMFLRMAISFSSIVLPLLGWVIFPRNWDFVLFGLIHVHSWNFFMLACGLPSLISGLLIIFLPESPKFLMSQGRNKEALLAFQQIYSWNKHQPRDTYPIKLLVKEAPSRDSIASEFIFIVDNNKNTDQSTEIKMPKKASRTFSEAICDGVEQVKPLFRKPLLGNAIFSFFMNFTSFFGLQTIRLWLPQLFASFSEVEYSPSIPSENIDLCYVLEYTVNKTANMATNFEERCSSPAEINMNAYINNMIVGAVILCGYVVGEPIAEAVGEKLLMIYGLFISACLGMSLYWANSSTVTLILSALYLTGISTATLSLLGTVLTFFPTSLRTIVVATCLMFGRLGALSGNMLFPIVIKTGCMPPFIMIALVTLCSCASAIFLPSAKQNTFT